MELARHMRIRNDLRRVLGHPLLGASRRLGQLPLVLEKVLQEVVAPQRRGLGPGHFNAARNRVCAVPRAVVTHPSHGPALPAVRLPARAPCAILGRHHGTCRRYGRRQ